MIKDIEPISAGMCVQRRFKSACASTQSDQSFSFPPVDTLNPWVPI